MRMPTLRVCGEQIGGRALACRLRIGKNIGIQYYGIDRLLCFVLYDLGIYLAWFRYCLRWYRIASLLCLYRHNQIVLGEETVRIVGSPLVEANRVSDFVCVRYRVVGCRHTTSYDDGIIHESHYNDDVRGGCVYSIDLAFRAGSAGTAEDA